MREIKFRAWDKEKKEWETDGIIIEIETGLPWWIEFGEMMDEAEDIILVEYTGLKDKNGKEIYEEDIVKKGRVRFIIEFRDGAFEMIGINIISVARLSHSYRDIEIIGNKFENPELMK